MKRKNVKKLNTSISENYHLVLVLKTFPFHPARQNGDFGWNFAYFQLIFCHFSAHMFTEFAYFCLFSAYFHLGFGWHNKFAATARIVCHRKWWQKIRNRRFFSYMWFLAWKTANTARSFLIFQTPTDLDLFLHIQLLSLGTSCLR